MEMADEGVKDDRGGRGTGISGGGNVHWWRDGCWNNL